jgi:hypothetical protein
MAVFGPIPVQHYLVPERTPTAPEGFTLVEERILNGLPHAIRLDPQTRLVLLVPTGLARTWRDAAPEAIVSRSDEGLAPLAAGGDASVGEVDRTPARLLLRSGTRTLASVPLVAGLRRSLPDAGLPDSGTRVEVVILSWDLRAGSMRGAGDFGSRISLAWRYADRAVERFSTPPPNPNVVPRLEAKFKTASLLGLTLPKRMARFKIKKAVRR